MTEKQPASGSKTIRVLLVENYWMVRDATKALLATDPGIAVVGEADSMTTALESIEQTEPDIALVDIRLRESSGIDLAKAIRRYYPSVKVIALTEYDYRGYVTAIARAGGSGYLLKSACSRDELVRAVHDVYNGHAALSRELSHALIDLIASGSDEPSNAPAGRLTIRELEVLEMVQGGLTSRQIAGKLGISTKTVNVHIGHILSKLGEPNRAAALEKATALGLI